MNQQVIDGIGRADTGDLLYLYGGPFDDIAEVTFNGLPARILAVEPGRMTVDCPTHEPAEIVAVSKGGLVSEPFHFPGLYA